MKTVQNDVHLNESSAALVQELPSNLRQGWNKERGTQYWSCNLLCLTCIYFKYTDFNLTRALCGWLTFYIADTDLHTRACLRTNFTRITHEAFRRKTAEKHFTRLKSQIQLERRQHKHHASSGRCSDSLSNAINDVITAIKTCRLVKQKMISHLVPVRLVTELLVDMLGICVCLCAVFSHVLSQEAEPISYTVSGLFFFFTTKCFVRASWSVCWLCFWDEIYNM